MTIYAIRMGDPGLSEHERVGAYVEGGEPKMLAVMRLIENFGSLSDDMVPHLIVNDDGRGGARATVQYNWDQKTGEHRFGTGDLGCEVHVSVADQPLERDGGGADLYTIQHWEFLYEGEALAARRALQDAEWRQDRDVDIANGEIPDLDYHYCF